MKAITYNKFGPPEVLQYSDVDKPTPTANEILIKNYASTVAAEDPTARGSRGINGILKPKKKILGWYFAGTVESVGVEVKKFKPGDKVYGSTRMKLGAHAEYIILPEDGSIAFKPENLSYEEAAAIPNGALTSLPFLRDKGMIKPGQKLLINGASGTVGLSAIQMGKYFGAKVTAVCSGPNIELVQKTGADHAIDYTNEDFTKNGEKYDIIFDAVGKSSFGKCKVSLTEKGIYMATTPKLSPIFSFLKNKIKDGKKARFAATGLRKSDKQAKDLNIIKLIVEEEKLRPVIDRRYNLSEMAEAHKYVATGRKKGDVVIIINENYHKK